MRKKAIVVSRAGILVRIIVALLLVIAVVALPERYANTALLVLSSVLFLLMAVALVFPWRMPDLLGWEFFGLFLALGILFSLGTAQQFGWLTVPLPFVFRVGVRALIVIFEAGVLTGLIRVGGLRWRIRQDADREAMEARMGRVEARVTAEEARNDRSEARAAEAVQRADRAETRADVVDVQQVTQDERISSTEDVLEIKHTITKKPDSGGPQQ
jgi:hypothetical protein